MHQKQRLKVPDDVSFEDLQLGRDPVTGAVEFSWEPIERICEANGLDLDLFTNQHEDNVAGLIMAWYAGHRKAGGAADPLAEQLYAEVLSEDTFGQHRTQKGSVRPQ